MKLLSLWEPWASLMAIGAKQIETRSWCTDYRGWLAIHASKGGLTQAQLRETCFDNDFYTALMEFPPFREQVEANVRTKRWIAEVFPHGCIVAVVKLVNCYPTTLVEGPTEFLSAIRAPYQTEKPFGDYHPGRFAWLTSDRFQLTTPIPFRAAQGLINVPESVVQQIREQYVAAKQAK